MELRTGARGGASTQWNCALAVVSCNCWGLPGVSAVGGKTVPERPWNTGRPPPLFENIRGHGPRFYKNVLRGKLSGPQQHQLTTGRALRSERLFKRSALSLRGSAQMAFRRDLAVQIGIRAASAIADLLSSHLHGMLRVWAPGH